MSDSNNLESPASLMTLKVEEGFETCIFCKNELDNEQGSFILRCLHFCCALCLQGLGTGGKDCPVCKIKSQLTDLIENKLSVPLDTEIKCSNHPDIEANIWCNKCEWICLTCEKCHRELRLNEHPFQPHKLIFEGEENFPSKNNFTSVEDDMMCKEHPDEVYKLFCEMCKCFTCRNCQLEKHRNHDYIFLNEMTEGFKRANREIMSQLDYKKIVLKKSAEVFQKRNHQIENNRENTQKMVDNIIKSLENFVKCIENNLRKTIDNECMKRVQKNNDHVREAEEFIKIVNYTDEFLKRTLQLGDNDSMIMYLQKHISSHLNMLLNKEQVVANPDFNHQISIRTPSNWKQLLLELQSNIIVYADENNMKVAPNNSK